MSNTLHSLITLKADTVKSDIQSGEIFMDYY